MKSIPQKKSLLLSLCLSLGLTGCATRPELPAVTEDGLTRVNNTQADAVYTRPAADLGVYKKVALVEPQIAFRKNWQSDANSRLTTSLNRISDGDVQKMIAEGKKLLVEEFTKELTKGGYTVVTDAGPDVLVVKAAILELDVYAPDPSNLAGAWSKTYTEGAGAATLCLELFDSVTGQLLVRAFDRKTDENGGSYAWRIPRTHYTNLNDARSALGSWAEMLVKGLDRAKATKAP